VLRGRDIHRLQEHEFAGAPVVQQRSNKQYQLQELRRDAQEVPRDQGRYYGRPSLVVGIITIDNKRTLRGLLQDEQDDQIDHLDTPAHLHTPSHNQSHTT